MLWLRALVFIVIAPGTVAGLLPWLVRAHWFPEATLSLGDWRWVALVPAILGALIFARTIYDFVQQGRGTPAPWDPPRKLVTGGLHARCRNPMYIGVLQMIVAQAFWFENYAVMAYVVLVWAMFHLFVVLYEEPHLRNAFGSEWDDYAARVPRWLARRPR